MHPIELSEGVEFQDRTPGQAVTLTPMSAWAMPASDASFNFRYELHPVRQFVHISPEITSMTGYRPEDYYSEPDILLKTVHPDDIPVIKASLCGSLECGSRVTFRLLPRNGDAIWAEQRCSYEQHADKTVVGVSGTVRRITSGLSPSARIRGSQNMDALVLMAGGMAHDVNSLMTVILGFSELIQHDDAPGDRITEKIVMIKKAADHAATLTRQILDFARGLPLRPRLVNLNHMAGTDANVIRLIVGEENEVSSTHCPTLGWINAQPGQIEQIVMNLSMNARAAMPNGGKLSIETKNVMVNGGPCSGREVLVGNSGPHVLLSVTDTGCGMD
jgi:two-component system cell cycle sensor histidine kinase/response regulator CckA